MLTYIPLPRTIKLFNSQSGLYHPIPVAFTLVKGQDTLPKDFLNVGDFKAYTSRFHGGLYYMPTFCYGDERGYRYFPRYGKQLKEYIQHYSLMSLLTTVCDRDNIQAITFVNEDILLGGDEVKSLPRNFKMECV